MNKNSKTIIKKKKVKDFWEDDSCGKIYAEGQSAREYYETQSQTRYNLQPYIRDFAKFQEGKGKDILEVGVGMGADHIEWAKSQPNSLTGIDLTSSAVEHTQKRLSLYGFNSNVNIGDTEDLSFNDASFDLVYSWGVLHHTPNTLKAINEIYRVLRPGGRARIMIYHKYALTGYMLWIRYGLLVGKPFRSLNEIYANYLESPGTKAYTVKEAQELFSKFSQVNVKTQLHFGDLLKGKVGQRHRGILLSVAKLLWPRWMFKVFFNNHGLCLLIEAKK